MALLDGGLRAIFGAALAPLFLDATLHKTNVSGEGTGGFAVSSLDHPVKAVATSLSERERAISGLPDPAVGLSLLASGLTVAPDLGDLVTLAGRTFRLIRIDADPAGAVVLAVAVPV